jgi:hypothetical protein
MYNWVTIFYFMQKIPWKSFWKQLFYVINVPLVCCAHSTVCHIFDHKSIRYVLNIASISCGWPYMAIDNAAWHWWLITRTLYRPCVLDRCNETKFGIQLRTSITPREPRSGVKTGFWWVKTCIVATFLDRFETNLTRSFTMLRERIWAVSSPAKLGCLWQIHNSNS